MKTELSAEKGVRFVCLHNEFEGSIPVFEIITNTFEIVHSMMIDHDELNAEFGEPCLNDLT